MLTSTPILDDGAADHARSGRPRRPRGRQPVGDHRALGSGNARRRADDDATISNSAQFETQVDATVTLADRTGGQRDLTDDEIERAIAEIQSTIQKYRK